MIEQDIIKGTNSNKGILIGFNDPNICLGIHVIEHKHTSSAFGYESLKKTTYSFYFKQEITDYSELIGGFSYNIFKEHNSNIINKNIYNVITLDVGVHIQFEIIGTLLIIDLNNLIPKLGLTFKL